MAAQEATAVGRRANAAEYGRSTVAAVQHDIVWEDTVGNLSALAAPVVAAAAGGANLVVLTEMFATGFSMDTERTAQSEQGSIVSWMVDQAQRHGLVLAGSVAINDPAYERPVNRLLVVDHDGVRARYDKIHPFSYAREDERFSAGSAPVIVDIDGFRWGLTVCYDLRFADLYWEMAHDVDGFLVVANWPASRRTHWQALLTARAIENQAWVVGVNRVGDGGRLHYVGDSAIIDPSGRSVAEAAHRATVLRVDVDAAEVAEVRREFPFFADRR